MPSPLFERRRTEHPRPGRHILVEPRARADKSTVAHRQMPGRTRLCHKHNGPTNPRSARKTRLSHNNRVFTDVTVVTDLHEIVDFGSPPNACETEAAPINGRVGTDFHVAFDQQSSQLGRADTRIFLVTDKTKSLPSQDRPGMHNHAIPKLGALSNNRTGVEFAILTDLNIRVDVNTRMQDRSGTDSGSLPDGHTRSHRNPIGQFSRRRHHGPRTETRFRPLARQEMLRGTGKVQRGVRRSNRWPASRVKPIRNQDSPRSAFP